MADDGRSTLIAHCGAIRMTREQLRGLETPEAQGRWHKPIPHAKFADTLIDTVLADRGIKVVREEYAVQRTHLLFFALDFAADSQGLSALPPGQLHNIAGRGSNDCSIKREVGCGRRLMVCDNMMLAGALISLERKQTIGFDLKAELGEMVDRYLTQTVEFSGQIEKAQQRALTDAAAKGLIFDAFIKNDVMPIRLMPHVARDYFEPAPTQEDAMTDIVEHPRTLWSLHNAFTRAARVLKPQRKFEATTKLGGLLALASEN